MSARRQVLGRRIKVDVVDLYRQLMIDMVGYMVHYGFYLVRRQISETVTSIPDMPVGQLLNAPAVRQPLGRAIGTLAMYIPTRAYTQARITMQPPQAVQLFVPMHGLRRILWASR